MAQGDRPSNREDGGMVPEVISKNAQKLQLWSQVRSKFTPKQVFAVKVGVADSDEGGQ